jgi:hypothetical protein
MARLPTVEETNRAILDCLLHYVHGPGEVAPLMPIQMSLAQLGHNADAFQAALTDMAERGWIEEARAGFIRVTTTGFEAI